MRIPVVGRTLAQLSKMANPQAVLGGQSEALRWTYYDTQTYVDNTTLTLTYFAATNADATLSNMPTGGQIPAPQFFEIWYFSVDILLPISTALAPTAWADMFNLLVGGRPTFTFIISDKRYGPFPLTFFHASGGVQGVARPGDSTIGLVSSELANNGVFDGGYCVDGAIVIPPVTGFSAILDWGVLADIAANTLIRVNMDGVLHRRVL